MTEDDLLTLNETDRHKVNQLYDKLAYEKLTESQTLTILKEIDDIKTAKIKAYTAQVIQQKMLEQEAEIQAFEKLRQKESFWQKLYFYIIGFFFVTAVFFAQNISPIDGNPRFWLCLFSISLILSPFCCVLFFRTFVIRLLLCISVLNIFLANFIIWLIFLITPVQSIEVKVLDTFESSGKLKTCYMSVASNSVKINQYYYDFDCSHPPNINQTIHLNYKENFIGIKSVN